jgi:hypothetical protein
MECNMKTMIATGVALVAVLAAAYAALPPVRALVLGVGPYLLLLLCPLSMWLMMRSMSAHDDRVSAMTEDRQEHEPDPLQSKK